MTYALRGPCSLAAHALAAQMAPIIALTALAALGLPTDPFHEPFHARGLAPRRPYLPCVTSLRHSHQDSQHAAGARSVIAYRGLADCGKACQLGMTPRREQPVARLMTKRTLPTRCGSSPPTLTAA
jgi:hypothetical protein